jgi:hypothetical protein
MWYRPFVGFCDNGDEYSGSKKGGKLLDQMTEYQILKRDYATWS